ncbi:MAG: glycosyltransferase family 2 protein [Alphaproteobacteria bacterium CG_4_10_14_0_2_um_filter_63_37]|nr:MAG: hypothetical protein AUJ55_09765 [Proteobacteria bacterium CG1_02_64_396]PJA23747.1 MAG: glycosyltransferase family 2 protein [Alphaproteobacteria bacterium CG_4_10_14_0_2_um_filter_63_37]
MSKMPISVAIIAMNEEEKIDECLASVAWAEEIVVVDSGSTDRTLEIARTYTDRVVHRDWSGHIDQKNYALSLCSHDWVLSLDADERVGPELREALLQLREQGPGDFQGFEFNRVTWYLTRWIRHGEWYPDPKLRLVRQDVARWEGTNPHDRLVVEGKVGRLEGDLYHQSFSNIEEHLDTIQSFSSIAAREAIARGRDATVFTMLGHGLFAVFRYYVLQQGFRDGIPGVIIAVLSGCAAFTKYAKIWAYRRASQGVMPQEKGGSGVEQ